jgi:L-fuculose-phosphate aldolase
MKASRQLREELISTAHTVHARGWVANHDGNITVRRGPDRFLATPTAVSKAAVDHANLIEVDAHGKRVSGTAKPFSELSLHFPVYERREDVHAVIHAHPPYATAIACSGANLIERPFIAEVVVSLGDWIPTVPFAPPGPEARRALSEYVDHVDVVLLASHGVISWGRDLETAYLRMELVEHHARIAALAQATGGVRPLPDAAFAPLLAARAKAGLGKAAERAANPGQRPARFHAPRSAVGAAPSAGSDDLTSIVREEILRALREKK